MCKKYNKTPKSFFLSPGGPLRPLLLSGPGGPGMPPSGSPGSPGRPGLPGKPLTPRSPFRPGAPGRPSNPSRTDFVYKVLLAEAFKC